MCSCVEYVEAGGYSTEYMADQAERKVICRWQPESIKTRPICVKDRLEADVPS